VSAPPLSAGRKLGDKFEIVGVLGEGGTGIVYDARRIAPEAPDGAETDRATVPDEERIALKVIHPHLAGDKQIRGRFQREATILRRLDGKHLCPLVDFGELPDPRREGAGLLYMVLPKIDGEALDAMLKRERPIPIVRAVAIVRQVCQALMEAHAQGIIHRDLKPGNVLLSGGDYVFVVDFGMAKIVTGGGGTGTTGLTQHNMVFGTPEYMAPEQARGDELDARCDIYAAGVILYELLTCAVPFTGATPLNVLTATLTTTPKPPREVAPDRGISVALEAVVMHAIAKDPANRYPTAAALERAIEKAMVSPEDVEAVAPARRLVSVKVDESGADMHALTIPAPEPVSSGPVNTLRAAATPSDRSPRSAPTVRPPSDAPSRGWTLVWVIAALVGVTIGVWLSLR
jgi:serine/threonine-protein kinase